MYTCLGIRMYDKVPLTFLLTFVSFFYYLGITRLKFCYEENVEFNFLLTLEREVYFKNEDMYFEQGIK